MCDVHLHVYYAYTVHLVSNGCMRVSCVFQGTIVAENVMPEKILLILDELALRRDLWRRMRWG